MQIETLYSKVRFTTSNEALKNFTLAKKHEELTALIFQPLVTSLLINFQLNNLAYFFSGIFYSPFTSHVKWLQSFSLLIKSVSVVLNENDAHRHLIEETLSNVGTQQTIRPYGIMAGLQQLNIQTFSLWCCSQLAVRQNNHENRRMLRTLF